MLTLRKHRISRLEEFSDAVFGFALTLLVLSSSVPRSYADLMDLMRGLPAFASCFAILVWIWHEHDSFFEQFPMQDMATLLLNSLLLFTVLIYVYPLKFMFEAFMLQVFGLGSRQSAIQAMQFHELANAFTLYGLGFFALTALLGLLYVNAYRLRETLQLAPIAVFDARAQAGHHFVSAAIGLLVMVFALVAPLRLAFLSPVFFALMGPAHALYGARIRRQRDAFLAAEAREPQVT